MLPYGKQHLDGQDIAAVVRVLQSDFLTTGPEISKFEQNVAKFVGAKYAVAVSSGTAALHLAYLVAGLKTGDEIITTPNTFVATTNMALAVGAKPVFCDIRLDTYNIDEKQIEKLITKRTKAIVPVHFAGQPCDLAKIKRLAVKHRLVVIEDAAHALGAKFKGRPIGSGHGDLAIFSFHPVKAITTGEGGLIVTNNKKYYDRLKLLRSHGVTKDKKGFNVMTELGYNYRLTDFQAALGSSQLKKLTSFIRQRRAAVKVYEKKLKNLPIILPTEARGNYSGWHLYVIRTKRSADRLPLYKHLQQSGI